MKNIFLINILAFLCSFNSFTFSQSSECGFIITKAICLEGDNKFICLEGTDQNGINEWDILGGTCFQTHFIGQNICFSCNFPPPSIITVNHTFTPFGGAPQVCQRYFNVSCNPNCNDWNFNASNVNCNTILSINPNFSTPDPITWRFGDGTSSVQTPGNVRNVSHHYNTPGTYNVCVTISFDGSYYQTCCFDIFVPPCPVCEPDPISWEECPPSGENCCIKLTFNSPYNSPQYVWNFGDNSAEVTTTTNMVEHSFIGRGPFYMCVKYFIEGHEYTCCEWIDLPPCDCCEDADFNFYSFISNDYQSCMKAQFRCEPYCDRPGMTVHRWIYSDGTIIYTGTPNGSPPDHIFTNYANSTGQVCVTHQILCDNQIIDEVTKCLPVPRGAYLGLAGQNLNMSTVLQNQGGITVFDFITQNASNPLVPLLIEGNLTVDINSNFTGGVWNMAVFSIISVNSNITFGLDHTTIQTAFRVNPSFQCCRWNGLRASPLSILNWSSTTVTDAQIMLELIGIATSRGAILNFEDNSFLENVNGIRSFRHRPRFIDFHNNVFEGCKNCGVLCGCDEGTGIYIDLDGITSLSTSFPVTGSRNTIKNYENGIHGIDLNMVIKNFNILDIDNLGVIYDKNVSRNFNLSLDLIDFHNMPGAVRENIAGGGSHGLFANASIPYNSLTISEVFRGYDININQTKFNGTINSNQINTNGGTSNFGIQVSLTGTIDNNFTANANHIEVASGGLSCLGIALLSDVNNNQNADVKNNVISNAGLDIGAGIFVSNWKKSKVTDNIVSVGISKPGIEFSYSGSSLIQCNTSSNGSRGMLFNISPENDIVNNTCYANRNGVFFSGNCGGTGGAFIGYNHFNSSINEGSLYNNNAITGIQHHDKYNSWSPVVSTRKAWHQNVGLAALCQLAFPLGTQSPSLHFPNCYPPSLIFPEYLPAGLEQACSMGTGKDDYLQYHSNPYNTGETYNNLLSISGVFDEMSVPLITSTKQSIYELILANPTWTNDFSNLASFYSSNQNNFVGLSSVLRKQFADFEQTLLAQSQALSALYVQYDILGLQLESLNQQLQIETDPIIIQSLLTQMDAIELQMESIIQSINNQQLSNQQINLGILNALQTLNDNLPVVNLEEINEKKINTIILKIWMNEAILLADFNDLRSIAQMCYAYGGRAVFDAQNLCMTLLGEYYTQDDCTNGFANENPKLRSNSVFKVNVNPNPVSEELYVTISSNTKSENKILFELTNNLGVTLSPEFEKLSENEFKLKLSKIPNGLYYLSVKRGDNKETFKIIVNH
ncbi:MAG: PKD domain-containing protein [Saprospiraceae bacterium]